MYTLISSIDFTVKSILCIELEGGLVMQVLRMLRVNSPLSVFLFLYHHQLGQATSRRGCDVSATRKL